MRILIKAAVAVAALTAAAPAYAQWHDKAYTTRIETRPYYGATVTVESGVRVFRGLPPTRHMIINPHGQTPLNLGIQDTRIFEKSTSHNHYYDHSSDAAPYAGAGFVAAPGFVGGKFRRNGHYPRQGAGKLSHRTRPGAAPHRFRMRPGPMKRGGHH